MNEAENAPTSMSLSLIGREDDKLAIKKESLEPESKNFLENIFTLILNELSRENGKKGTKKNTQQSDTSPLEKRLFVFVFQT
jgi:hypothetical protein